MKQTETTVEYAAHNPRGNNSMKYYKRSCVMFVLQQQLIVSDLCIAGVMIPVTVQYTKTTLSTTTLLTSIPPFGLLYSCIKRKQGFFS